jgi:hypothetical protein
MCDRRVGSVSWGRLQGTGPQGGQGRRRGSSQGCQGQAGSEAGEETSPSREVLQMNEQEARTWINDLLDLAARLAVLSPNNIDDRIIQMAGLAVSSDPIWAWMWRVLGPVINGDGDLIVGAPEELVAEADKAGIDPLTILAIVNAIIELIKAFRNR